MPRESSITSQAGTDLLFASLSATEELGRLYSFQVKAVSKVVVINLIDLLGTPMTVKITDEFGSIRYFNGIVSEAGQSGFENLKGVRYASYQFELVPKPWLLSHKADCRIYKKKSVPDIIKLVLSEIGYTDVKLSLQAAYPKREYCVQYRESYFNFISRLMEQEGIYYYFTHTSSTHTMVLADQLGAHSKIKPKPELPYRPESAAKLAAEPSIFEFELVRSLHTSKYQLADYDPIKPRASLLSSDKLSDATQHHKVAGLVSFDYPGDFEINSDGLRYAQVRIDSLNIQQALFSGSSDALTLATGGLFTLKGFPRPELNVDYLVTSSTSVVEHGSYVSGGAAGTSLSVKFKAIASKQQFRSLQSTPKPVIAGVQTAVVCGSEVAEDIVIDEYGRVQVIFHWNKVDKPHHDISCPVRVASPWAGKLWGSCNHPRVGHEVVVSFLEGDPDRPLIVGSVYNGVNRQFMQLPATETWSGIVSRSLKSTDFKTANGILFKDTVGQERFSVQAQKDMNAYVKNDNEVKIDHDHTEVIKHDRKREVGNDETVLVKHDRKHDVTLNENIKIGVNQTIDVGQIYKLTAGTEIHLVTGASSIVMKADGTIEIKGVQISVTGSMSVKVEGQVEVGVKAGVAMDLGAGATLKMHSDAMLEVKGGALATVGAPMLMLKGDGMAQLSGGIIIIG